MKKNKYLEEIRKDITPETKQKVIEMAENTIKKGMTKTQKRREVTKRFMEYVGEKFPNYYTEDDGFSGYILLVPRDFEGYYSDNYISYHRSYFSLFCMKEACDQVKHDCAVMDAKLEEIVKEIGL